MTQFERDATLSILLASDRITDAEKQAIRDLVPSRRDYFAAMALNGMLSSETFCEENAGVLAKWSAEQAREMIEELDS